MRVFGLYVNVLLVCLFTVSCVCGQYSGGDGTEYEPYQIATAEDLYNIGQNPLDWSSHFVQTTDIDMSFYDGSTADRTYIPIGDENGSFTGSYLGQSYVISNLTINNPDDDNVGMFGVGSANLISGIVLREVNISGNDYVGALIGHSDGFEVSYCSATGVVSGIDYVGGLFGLSNAETLRCYSSCKVKGNYNAGGLAGQNYHDLYECYSTGNVSGNYNTGGLVGYNEYGYIEICYSHSFVSGGQNAGGLIGSDNDGSVYNCYSAGKVIGVTNVGGFCGDYEPGLTSTDGCFWDLETSGQSVSAFGTGLLTSDMKILSTFVDVGWISDPLDLEHDKWFMFNDGVSYPVLKGSYRYSGGKGTGSEPYQLASPEDLYALCIQNKDWDSSFILTSDIDMYLYDSSFGNRPFMPIGVDSYDYSFSGNFDGQDHVISNLIIDGVITEDSRYGYYVGLFGHFRSGTLKNLHLDNIYVKGSEYDEQVGGLIGWCGQSDSVIVENCSVTGTVISKSNYCYTGGLIGRLNSRSVVSGCYSDVIVIAESMEDSCSSLAGVMFGWVNGTVYNCKASGEVNVENFNSGKVGGFAGKVKSKATISDCYSETTINVSFGDETYIEGKIGGFCGDNGCTDSYSGESMIENCYYSGEMNIESLEPGSDDESFNIGGFCGYNKDNIVSCFWDVETSGIEMSSGGSGLTTAEMKNKATFTGAGWRFAVDNGPWIIADGYSYPILMDHYGFSGGEGSIEEPYLVGDIGNLIFTGSIPYAHYKLVNDIDLTGFETADAIIGASFDNPFTGTFDGNGHVISNLTIYGLSDKPAGLFGVVSGEGAVISDLGLENVDYYALGRKDVGGIVGFLNLGKIINCFVTGAVRGRDYTGGLAGYANGAEICNCYHQGFVDCFTFGGGLVGCSQGTNIYSSYSSSSLICFMFAGGVTGAEMDSMFDNTFFDISISDDNGFGIGLMPFELENVDTFLNAGWDFNAEDANGSEDIWHMPFGVVGMPMLWYEKDIPGDMAGSYGVDMADFGMIAEDWLDGYDITDIVELAGCWMEGK